MDLLETIKHDFSFPGHVLPGTAFMIMGFWWMFKTFKIYFKMGVESCANTNVGDNEPLLHCRSNVCKFTGKAKNSKSELHYPATFPIGDNTNLYKSEGFIKLTYASFDLFCHILVVITGGSLVDESQHITVYIFFILNAMMDVALFRVSSRSSRNVLVNSSFALGTFAWSGFGFLFLSHKHHKSEIQIYYHSLLAWVAIGVAIAYLIQWRFQRSPVASLLRSCTCILAGSWLYQIAFTFHNPFIAKPSGNMHSQHNATSHSHSHDAPNEHEMIMQIMFGAVTFTWHMILIAILTIITGYMISRMINRSSNSSYIAVSQC